MKKIFGILLIFSFFITSCSYRVVDFTIISTKNIDLSQAATFQRAKTRNEGKDISHIILSIPLGNPNMKEAIDRALETIPGGIALVDGVVYSKWWWAIIYGQRTTLVEGSPLIDPKLAGNSTYIPGYSVATLDKYGNIKEFKEISEQEYLAVKSKVIKGAKKRSFKNSSELE